MSALLWIALLFMVFGVALVAVGMAAPALASAVITIGFVLIVFDRTFSPR